MSVVYYGNYLTYFACRMGRYLRSEAPYIRVNKRIHMPVVEALVRYVQAGPARTTCSR